MSAKARLQRNNRDWELQRQVRTLLEVHGAIELHPQRSSGDLFATAS
jgi:hypothetical protein